MGIEDVDLTIEISVVTYLANHSTLNIVCPDTIKRL